MKTGEVIPSSSPKRTLTIQGRLGSTFAALLGLGLFFSGAILLDQHRMAEENARLTRTAHQGLIHLEQLRADLTAAEHRFEHLAAPARLGAPDAAALRSSIGSLGKNEFVTRPDGGYPALRDSLVGYLGGEPARGRTEVALTQVDSFLARSESDAYRLSDDLRARQARSVRYEMILLAVLALLLVVAAYRGIVATTRPLSDIAQFVDALRIEEDFPAELPRVRTSLREVEMLTKSFERLLARLRGFQSLNVQRLLQEKQRADIIAASISDGIVLLKGDEISYANPVAERIIGTGGLGAGMPALGAEAARAKTSIIELAANPGDPGRGARAIVSAISRTIPVEFALEDADRKQHYLIQAYPISADLIRRLSGGGGAGPFDESAASAAAARGDLEKFQGSTLVVAQDVTLVREGQEAKTHFLATLSHEIKTPVTSLTMATRLLKRASNEITNPSHQALIQTCVSDVDRLRGLLDDLLTVSHFETLTQRVQLQNIDLVKLVRNAVQSFRPQADERGLELVWKPMEDLKSLTVPMDAAKINWALSNLLTNALRHTPKGGRVEVELQMETARDTVDAGHGAQGAVPDSIRVIVRDTGAGIDRKRLSRIFDKFNTYYDLRVARTGGAGVGLAIAREIVQAHGGRIWVASQQGQGAEFCFSLPLKNSPPKASADSQVPPGLTPANENSRRLGNGATARS